MPSLNPLYQNKSLKREILCTNKILSPKHGILTLTTCTTVVRTVQPWIIIQDIGLGYPALSEIGGSSQKSGFGRILSRKLFNLLIILFLKIRIMMR